MKYNDLMTKYLKILISLTCALCLEHRCINEMWIQHQGRGPVDDCENYPDLTHSFGIKTDFHQLSH